MSEKVELSVHESGKIIGLLVELDCIIDDKNLDNNEYVSAYKGRIKKEVQLRTKSLLRKMEKAIEYKLTQEK